MKEDIIEILGIPSVSLITGKRGSGKSCLGHLILELAYKRGLTPNILGLPEGKWHLLPEFIVPIKELDEVTDDSAVFMDESYMYLFSREAYGDFNKAMAKFLGVSRQKNILLLFATHLTRKLDVSCIYDADNIIFRQPSFLHIEFEREEIREYIRMANTFFKEVDNPVRYAFIVTSKGITKIEVDLPTYWNEELSRAFSGISFTERKLQRKYKKERCWQCKKTTDEYLLTGDVPFCLKCAEEIGNKFLWSFPKHL